MPKIDLVTGFLGSGKTTFIKKYAKALVDRGLTVGILENDYGAINIDMVFLDDLVGENCDIEMIVGGDGIISHSRRFRTKLISMAMVGYDRVIVEPSGIYDTDEFFDALEEDPLCRWYSPGSIISIVDAGMEENISEETQYLLVSQTDCAGRIVMSRCGSSPDVMQSSPASPERILSMQNRAAEPFKSDRRFTESDILAKDWKELTQEDFDSIAECGMVPSCHVKLPVHQSSGYGTLFYYGIKMGEETLRSNLSRTFSDPACGKVMRIKGFCRIIDSESASVPDKSGTEIKEEAVETAGIGKIPERNGSSVDRNGGAAGSVRVTNMQVNATPDVIRVEPTIFAQQVLIITGENLDRERIDGIWAGFAEIITPGKTTM